MNYYDILGVESNATQEEIRAAYREWMSLIHPDRNRGNPRAEELAKRVNETYQVLSDPQKRAEFDLRRRGYSCQEGRDGYKDVNESNERSPAQYRDPVILKVSLTLEQIDRGCKVRESCPAGHFSIGQQPEAQVPPGARDGDHVVATCPREFHDVIFVIRVLPHPVFERNGPDLFTEVYVRESDVKKGTTVPVATLRYESPFFEKAEITLPQGIQSGQQVRLEGYGLPFPRNRAQRGDLIVKVHVRN